MYNSQFGLIQSQTENQTKPLGFYLKIPEINWFYNQFWLVFGWFSLVWSDLNEHP